jgi:hypothetical protein
VDRKRLGTTALEKEEEVAVAARETTFITRGWGTKLLL